MGIVRINPEIVAFECSGLSMANGRVMLILLSRYYIESTTEVKGLNMGLGQVSCL